jgi:hypothetical protein
MPTRLERLTQKIQENLHEPTVVHRFGGEWLKTHGEQRRIVWVSMPSATERPRQAGGRLVGPSGTGTRQVAAFNLLEAVEAHVYAESDAVLDELFNKLLVAIDDTVPNSPLPTFSRPTEEEVGAGRTRKPKMIVGCIFRMPVIVENAPLVPIEGEIHECKVETE